jgi:hypothetical protein
VWGVVERDGSFTLLELASCKALLYAPGSLAAPVKGGQHVKMRTQLQVMRTSNRLSVAMVLVTSGRVQVLNSWTTLGLKPALVCKTCQ